MDVVAGIDIGGTNTVFGLVDRNGKILIEDKVGTRDFDEVSVLLEAVGRRILDWAERPAFSVRGIGVGAPNGNYYNGTILKAPNLIMQEDQLNVVELLSQLTGIQTVLTNDANAAAIGEMLFGAGRGLQHFIMITLGTGLGSGIVVDGRILYGKDGFAGELGHVVVEPDGRMCTCGRRGCLETYVSARGVADTVREMVRAHAGASLLKDRDPDSLNPRDVYEAAISGDKVALDVFDYTAQVLGLALANAIAYTNPEAVFLFGGIANAGDLLLAPTRKYLKQNLLYIYDPEIRLEVSGLNGKNAGLLGGAALAWRSLKGVHA